MQTWPATPGKVEAPGASATSSASASSIRVAVPNLANLDRRAPSAKGKSPSSRTAVEPSPASTYGETAAGDSVPPTPGDVTGSTSITGTLRTLQIDAGNEASPIGVSFEQSTAVFSPTHHSYGLHEVSPEAAAAKLHESVTGTNTPSRRRAGPAVTSPSGVRRSGRVTTSPGSARRGDAIRNTNWRTQRSVSFAVPPGDNDPFFEGHGSSARNGNTEGQPAADGTGSTVPGDSPLPYRPREDREVVEISGDNAQALFPPSSCVFVANLVQGLTDEQLEYSVSRAFEQFGKVYVKIKRDPRGMPYAFCQYENPEDSERAIQYGRGLLIDGRQCRTERAKVNRSLYLTRITGGPIPESEAREVLRGRGDIEKFWHPSPTEKEMFRLGDGIWVMFAFFQDCRDAQALFKDNVNYRLETPHHPDEVQARASTRSGPSPLRRQTPAHRYVSPPQYRLRQSDRNWVFVSNLPSDVTQAQIRGVLASYGNIRSVEIISRPVIQGTNANVFAYVEFSHEEEVRRAINNEHILEGVRLRVEPKESLDSPASRLIGGMSGGSPHPRRPGAIGSISRDVAMARAFAAGVDAATVLQIFNPEYGFQQAAEPRSASGHATVGAPVFGPNPYQNYYAASYPQFAMAAPAGTDGDQAGAAIYGAATQVHPPMGHYQYSGNVAPHFYPGYASATTYGYQAPTNDMAVNMSNANATDHQL